MKRNHLILGLLGLSLVGIGAGFVFTNSVDFNLCTQTALSCRDLLNRIGDSLFYSMQAIAFIFAVLLFVPQAFSAWRKFAVWFLPLMFVYFAIYDNKGFFSVPEESVYRFFSIVYAVLSLAVIGWSALRSNKEIN